MNAQAEAQPAGSSADLDTETKAKTLYRQGTVLYAEGDYENAALALEESYQLSARAELLFNLANVYERNGQPEMAVERLRRYLPDADPSDQQALRKRIARLDERFKLDQENRRLRATQQSELEMLRARPPVRDPGPTSEVRSQRLVLGLAAGSIVLFGLGTGAAIAANSADDRVREACAPGQEQTVCLASADGAITSRRRWSLMADISIGLGLVSAATAGYLYWQGSRTDSATGPRVVPSVGPTTMGSALSEDSSGLLLMPSALRSPTLIMLLIATSMSGCSLSGLETSACETQLDCTAAFGAGARCVDEFCVLPSSTPRCNQTYPEDLLTNPELHSDSIIIGSLMDRSLATQRARENAIRLALKQASTTSPIDGHSVAAVFCTVEGDGEFDELSREQAALESARYLIDELSVPAIIGPSASDDVLFVFQELNRTDTLFLSPSATSPSLSALDPETVTDEMPGMLWRTAPPDTLQAEAIAYDMLTPGPGRTGPVESVGVIHDSGIYGTALAESFAAHFQQAGGTVTLLPYTTQAQLSDRVAEASLSTAAEVLFISSQTIDVIAFLDGAAALSGFDDKAIFLTDSAANADVLRDASPTRFGAVRGTRPAGRLSTELVFAGFLASYFSEYGEDAAQFSFSAHAYDAAWLVAAGAAWSLFNNENVTGTGVAQGLRQVSTGPSIEIRSTSWTQILERFRRGEAVDLVGTSGELDFDPETEETNGRVETWVISDGEVASIGSWPPMSAPE